MAMTGGRRFPARLRGRRCLACPFVEVGEHEVGAVDLVAGGAAVFPDRAQGGPRLTA